MNKQPIAKVLSGNRITIPKAYCKELRIATGNIVGMNLHDGEIRIIPLEIKPRKRRW